MSNRTHILELVPIDEKGKGRGETSFAGTEGDAHIYFLRDDDTRSFRLFLNIKFGQCVDLTLAEIVRLRDAFSAAIDAHKPWTDDDGNLAPGRGE